MKLAEEVPWSNFLRCNLMFFYFSCESKFRFVVVVVVVVVVAVAVRGGLVCRWYMCCVLKKNTLFGLVS